MMLSRAFSKLLSVVYCSWWWMKLGFKSPWQPFFWMLYIQIYGRGCFFVASFSALVPALLKVPVKLCQAPKRLRNVETFGSKYLEGFMKLRSSYEPGKCQLMEAVTVAKMYGSFCPLYFWQCPRASASQGPLRKQQQINCAVGKASSSPPRFGLFPKAGVLYSS